MKVNLREIIHYIDESTLEKAKNEKVQKQESPSKMSKDVEESVDKMISNRMSKAYSEWRRLHCRCLFLLLTDRPGTGSF